MLRITIPSREVYDEESNLFFETNEYTLKMEHSLLSISKWESKYHKHFLLNEGEKNHSATEMMYYYKCMTLNPNVPDIAYTVLSKSNIKQINEYIENPMTATTVNSRKIVNRRVKQDIITSELIYYWMTAFNIPFECEKWHINRLLMLIKVCNAMNAAPDKSKPDMAARRRLNEQRLAEAKARAKR